MLETRFRAMGTDVHAVLVGGEPSHVDTVRARIAELEVRWSRFLPDSDIGRLNGAAGRPVPVSGDTVVLLDAILTGYAMTEGLFDPSIHDALVAAGYARSYEELVGTVPAVAAGAAAAPGRSPGLGTLELDPEARTARLHRGVRVDPGAIGKGLAADLVVTALLADGVSGASISLGGDLRVCGEAPDPAGWGIEVEGPSGDTIGLIGLGDGAVATSTTARRRWVTTAGEQHHVIDPRTGSPAASDLASVTVVAGRAWLAEVLATAVLVAGSEQAPTILGDGRGSALLVDRHGKVSLVGRMEDHLW